MFHHKSSLSYFTQAHRLFSFQDGQIDYEEFVEMMRHGNGVDEIKTFSEMAGMEGVVPIESKLGLSPSVIPRTSMELPRPIEVAA